MASIEDKRRASLLNKYLTHDLKQELSSKETEYGGTLELIMKSGVEILDSACGVFATDPDAYNVFGELLHPIVADIHDIKHGEVNHPSPYFGDPHDDALELSKFDVRGCIISTRVRVGRNVAGFPFSTSISVEDRQNLERKIETALESLPGELQGHYRHLSDIEDSEQLTLIREHVLYDHNNRFLKAAGVYRDWPSGRGLFTNADRSLIVWVNEEDNLRIISLKDGSDLKAVFSSLIKMVNSLERLLEFAYDPQLGYLTVCPTNLGTGLRASVLISLPNVSKLSKFKTICSQMQLDIRGTHGECTEAQDAIYDISNKHRLGLTEWDALRQFSRGVKILLLLEESLEIAAGHGQ